MVRKGERAGEKAHRQEIFQLVLLSIVDYHGLCECKSGQITNADPQERTFSMFSLSKETNSREKCVYCFWDYF